MGEVIKDTSQIGWVVVGLIGVVPRLRTNFFLFTASGSGRSNPCSENDEGLRAMNHFAAISLLTGGKSIKKGDKANYKLCLDYLGLPVKNSVAKVNRKIVQPSVEGGGWLYLVVLVLIK